MTNIDNLSSNNILINTSFNPFEENIINIKNNKSKTVKDFFSNNYNKPFINQIGRNFIIKNSKIKRAKPARRKKLTRKTRKTQKTMNYELNNDHGFNGLNR